MTASRRVAVEAAGLGPGRTRVVALDGLEILLCNVEGRLYAVRNVCPHQAFPLTDARLRGPLLECSMHGGRFDVRDGCPARAPTRDGLATYPVHERDGRIEVELPCAICPQGRVRVP